MVFLHPAVSKRASELISHCQRSSAITHQRRRVGIEARDNASRKARLSGRARWCACRRSCSTNADCGPGRPIGGASPRLKCSLTKSMHHVALLGRGPAQFKVLSQGRRIAAPPAFPPVVTIMPNQCGSYFQYAGRGRSENSGMQSLNFTGRVRRRVNSELDTMAAET